MLKGRAVTHLVGLPDNASAPLFTATAVEPTIQTITVTREGEAFAIASGLWIGGATPVVVIQNTGLLESGDALRGTAVRMGIPLTFFVTCRGYEKLVRGGLQDIVPPIPRAYLVRPEVDSVAVLTEPTLNAWGIPYRRIASDDDTALLESAFATAHDESRPTAALLLGNLG